MTETVVTFPVSPEVFTVICLLGGLFLGCLAVFGALRHARMPEPKHWLAQRGWPEAVLFTLIGVVWLGLMVLSISTAFGFLLGVNPQTASPGNGSAAAGGSLGAGALIAALLGGPFLIWGTWLKHRTVGFQQEGHITDRINKAVEHLGAEKTVKETVTESLSEKPVEHTKPNIEMRIGGLLSLQRIAEDSMRYDRGRDHIRVMQIICAYIRHNSPARDLEPTPAPFTRKTPRIDIQTAVDVLRRRSAKQVEYEAAQRYRVDLRAIDLDGIDLSGGDFSGANFMRSRFEASNLQKTNLTGVWLSQSILNFADFYGATMRGTLLDGVRWDARGFGDLADIQNPSISIQDATIPHLYIDTEARLHFFGSSKTVIDNEIWNEEATTKLKKHFRDLRPTRTIRQLNLTLGHVDKWRSHSLMQATSTKPRKLTAVLS